MYRPDQHDQRLLKAQDRPRLCSRDTGLVLQFAVITLDPLLVYDMIDQPCLTSASFLTQQLEK